MSEQLHSYPPRLSLDHGVITYPTFTIPQCAWIHPGKAGPNIVHRSYHVGDPIWLVDNGDSHYTPYLFDGYTGGTTYNEEGKWVRRIAFITSEEFGPTQKITCLFTPGAKISKPHCSLWHSLMECFPRMHWRKLPWHIHMLLSPILTPLPSNRSYCSSPLMSCRHGVA
jgi:hypothetical protein